jgi:hypothetical protein
MQPFRHRIAIEPPLRRRFRSTFTGLRPSECAAMQLLTPECGAPLAASASAAALVPLVRR